MEDKTLDLGGVVCPMTWMRTRMRLSTMKPGERLVVVLDEGKPAIEFPRSAKSEGHKLVAATRLDGRVVYTVENKGLGAGEGSR